MANRKYNHSQTQRPKKYNQSGGYVGGRGKGEKNLLRLEDGSLVNKHKVVFTEAEKKALESAVNAANRKRARMMKEESKLTGVDVNTMKIFNKESDFILAPKTKSLQRFKSKAEFENYMDNLREVNDRGYIDKRTAFYRGNYYTALDRAFGDDAREIKMILSEMSPKEYRELVAKKDDTLEIGYLYLDGQYYQKLNEIRRAVGLDPVEAPEIDPGYKLRRSPRKPNKPRKAKRK